MTLPQGAFADDGPFNELRVVMGLHQGALTLVAVKGTDSRHLDNITGKRVYLGEPGSGVMATAQQVVAALGPDHQPQIVPLKSSEAVHGLCSREIDATFMMFFHPSPVLENVMEQSGRG